MGVGSGAEELEDRVILGLSLISLGSDALGLGLKHQCFRRSALTSESQPCQWNLYSLRSSLLLFHSLGRLWWPQ